VFVAVGDEGTVLRSTDGLAWTTIPFGANVTLRRVVYANGTFVAVSSSSTQSVFTSSNGSVWTDRSAGVDLSTWKSLDDVVYFNGMFLGGGWYSNIRYSTNNGVSWQAARTPSGVNYNLDHFAVGEGVVIAMGTRMSEPSGRVLLVSRDGLDWKESATAPSNSVNGLTWGNGCFVATASNGDMERTDPFYPTNRTPIASITAPGSGTAREPIFFQGGSTELDGDGVTYLWDFEEGSPFTSGQNLYKTYMSGGTVTQRLYVVDEKGGIGKATNIMTMEDSLSTWSYLESVTNMTTDTLYDIASNGSQLLTGGRGDILMSSDGSNWVKTANAGGGFLRLRRVLERLFVGRGRPGL